MGDFFDTQMRDKNMFQFKYLSVEVKSNEDGSTNIDQVRPPRKNDLVDSAYGQYICVFFGTLNLILDSLILLE